MVDVQPVFGAANQRLGQIHRVVRNDQPGQVVLVVEASPDQILGQCRLVALRHAVAAVIVLF